jgi:hypothetical protein
MASAGSSSLTVAEVRADGSLLVTDHLIDDLAPLRRRCHVATARRRTRLPGGRRERQRVSLFEILPGGRLLLLSTVADTTGTTLSGSPRWR